MSPRLDPSLIPDTPDLRMEGSFWRVGYRHIAGIDEAGRGALAGPVAAAAVIMKPDGKTTHKLKGLKDSKELTVSQRNTWFHCIQEVAWDWGIGFASPQEIDMLGIVPATRLAAWRALETLKIQPDHLLLDYLFVPDFPNPQTSLMKGDQRSLSIAGASVLAKVARDAHLCDLDAHYPEYGFAANKGYGTRAHREAIDRFGPSPVHRLSFAPMRTFNSQHQGG